MSSFLISDVRIFDGENTVESGFLLVEGGKIKQVSETPISYSGTTISKPGHTVFPGLIDCHVHCDGGNPSALPQSLRFGVTTVCDMHNEYPNIEKLRKQIAEEGDCADLKTTSYAATVEMGWPMPVIVAHSTNPNIHEEFALWPKLEKPSDAAGYIQDRLKEGVDYIKLMHESGALMGAEFNKPSLELQKAVIDEAHAHNLTTVAHALVKADTLAILSAGVDGLTHQFCDAPMDQSVIDAYKRNNAHLNPTLAALGSLTTEGKATQERFAHDPRVQHLLPEEARHRVCACMEMCKVPGASVEFAYEAVRQLKAAGVDVLVGSDSAGPAVGTAWGLSMHHELYLFVKHCGFSPAEALRAATFLNAKRFGFKDRGQIKEGLRADLVLVYGNPLEDIDATLDLKGVWKEGELCQTHRAVMHDWWRY